MARVTPQGGWRLLANRILRGLFSGRGTELHRRRELRLARYVPLWRRARAARILYALTDQRVGPLASGSAVCATGKSTASDLRRRVPAPHLIERGPGDGFDHR